MGATNVLGTWGDKRAQAGTWGRQTCFLPRAPSNLLTPLTPGLSHALGRMYLPIKISSADLM